MKEQCTPTSQPRRCCDYHRHFLTFFVKQHMTIAPEQPFQRDPEARAAVCLAIDRALALPHNTHVKKEDRDDDHDMMDVGDYGGGGDAPVAQTRGITKEEMAELLHMPPHKMASRRGKAPPYRTRDIIARAENPDDPGLPPLWPASGIKPKSLTSLHYLQLLNRLPHKFLKFAEDVRPPYSGTFTKCPTKHGLRTGRNPFERALPGTDYNYDSEAEWVADEDGEDLLSDEDDDDHSDGGGADSIDGFLDDEDDTVAKRGGMAALIPTNSGICWEDVLGRPVRPDLEEMRIGVLIGASPPFFSRRFFCVRGEGLIGALGGVSGPIDPFSTKYWEPEPKPALTNMDPPQRPSASTTHLPLAATAGPSSGNNRDEQLQKLIPPEMLEDFKRAIEGSDMTKAALVEQLKKRFPKIGKENIRNSLSLVAHRVWMLK